MNEELDIHRPPQADPERLAQVGEVMFGDMPAILREQLLDRCFSQLEAQLLNLDAASPQKVLLAMEGVRKKFGPEGPVAKEQEQSFNLALAGKILTSISQKIGRDIHEELQQALAAGGQKTNQWKEFFKIVAVSLKEIEQARNASPDAGSLEDLGIFTGDLKAKEPAAFIAGSVEITTEADASPTVIESSQPPHPPVAKPAEPEVRPLRGVVLEKGEPSALRLQINFISALANPGTDLEEYVMRLRSFVLLGIIHQAPLEAAIELGKRIAGGTVVKQGNVKSEHKAFWDSLDFLKRKQAEMAKEQPGNEGPPSHADYREAGKQAAEGLRGALITPHEAEQLQILGAGMVDAVNNASNTVYGEVLHRYHDIVTNGHFARVGYINEGVLAEALKLGQKIISEISKQLALPQDFVQSYMFFLQKQKQLRDLLLPQRSATNKAIAEAGRELGPAVNEIYEYVEPTVAQTPHGEVAFFTNKGVGRGSQQDRLYVNTNKEIFVVADGMGSYRDGGLVAQIVVEEVKQAADGGTELGRPVHDAAQARIDKDAFEYKIGTGTAACYAIAQIDGDNLIATTAGDSQICVERKGRVVFTTPIEREPDGRVNNYIANGERTEPKINSFHLEPGDRILGYSDVLTDNFDINSVAYNLVGESAERSASGILTNLNSRMQAGEAALKVLTDRYRGRKQDKAYEEEEARILRDVGKPDNVTVFVFDYKGERVSAQNPPVPDAGRVSTEGAPVSEARIDSIVQAALGQYKAAARADFVTKKLVQKPGTDEITLNNLFEQLWELGEGESAKKDISEALKKEGII